MKKQNLTSRKMNKLSTLSSDLSFLAICFEQSARQIDDLKEDLDSMNYEDYNLKDENELIELINERIKKELKSLEERTREKLQICINKKDKNLVKEEYSKK